MEMDFNTDPGRGSRWWLAAALVLPLALATIALSPLTAIADRKNEAYVLGVFPHLPPRDLEKVFAPMAADLSTVLGKPVELRTSATYEKFSSGIDSGKFDIAFVQPFDYIRAADKHGYLPLATRTEKLAVIVVTSSDSPLTSIQDLRNKKVALPPRTAAVSHLLRGYLKSEGIDPDRDLQLTHHRSHVSCMHQVLIGEAVACGTAAPARRFFQGKYKVSLKILGKSREIPHTLWTAHSRVPARDRRVILNRILDWSNTREGQILLERGKLTPFVAVDNSAYDVVRKLARLQ
jgi:phosphonate transport system substrate-binding protein